MNKNLPFTVKYYSPIKNKMLTLAWVDIEVIVLSEVRQRKK